MAFINNATNTAMVIEECRRKVKKISIPGNYRVTAEIILKNGERRIYRAKSIDRNAAVSEVLTFVDAIEKNTGETVTWRLKGENTYYISTNYTQHNKPSLLDRIYNYFFGEEYAEANN